MAFVGSSLCYIYRLLRLALLLHLKKLFLAYVIDYYNALFPFSGTSEVRFPINIGITGYVATTGEVFPSTKFF